MMKNLKLTAFGKVLAILLVVGLVGGGGYWGYQTFFNKEAAMPSAGDTKTPGNNPTSSTNKPAANNNTSSSASGSRVNLADPTIYLSLDEWIGWKPIIDANGGFDTAPGSIFDKLGIKVNIAVINDGADSSNALIAGDLNAAGYTTNRTAFLSGKFKEAGLDIIMPVFTNYSYGGDGIISLEGINTAEDFVGKRVGVPRFSEAHTLVAWFVDKSDLPDSQKQEIYDNLILFGDAEETGLAFFAGQLDVAATWQPYLSNAAAQSGTQIMFDTRASKSLIMDGIVFRRDWAEANAEVVSAFIDGIFQANELYTKSFNNIRTVMPMFAEMSDAEILEMTADAEMAGYAGNKEILSKTAPRVYSDMCDIWESLGETVDRSVGSTLFDSRYLSTLSSKYTSNSGAITTEFVEMTEEKKAQVLDYRAMMEKSITIEFVGDMAVFLDNDAALDAIDTFVDIAKTLDGAIIQIEGNINARQETEAGKKLSLERAEAVATAMIAQGIDPNRIITVGNGNTKMLVDPNSADAKLNRRTDVIFKMIEE